MKTIKDAFKKKLEENASELMLEVDNLSNDKIASMTTAEYLAFQTLRKIAKKPTSVDMMNIAKVAGELSDATTINITPLDEALKDCKVEIKED